MDFDRFLCDLGASVSLIPFSVCKKLDIEDMKPTNVSLKLADRSFEYPIVLLEDVMVRVGEYYVSVDFVLMDINEYCQIPIILGMPFLATTGVIIDFKRGKLTFEVGDGKIEFILEKLFRNPSLREYCYLFDFLSGCVHENAPDPPSPT